MSKFDEKYIKSPFKSVAPFLKGLHVFNLKMKSSSDSKLTFVHKSFGIETLTDQQNLQLAFIVVPPNKTFCQRPCLG